MKSKAVGKLSIVLEESLEDGGDGEMGLQCYSPQSACSISQESMAREQKDLCGNRTDERIQEPYIAYRMSEHRGAAIHRKSIYSLCLFGDI